MRTAKNITSLAIAAVFTFVVFSGYAGDDRLKVPRVAYTGPADQSTVDLTGKSVLTFSWNPVPAPAGGREQFRFRIYEGFSYKVIFAAESDEHTFSIDVPADEFEDGKVYTWRVQQRDARNMIWSLYDTWSFKVLNNSKNSKENGT